MVSNPKCLDQALLRTNQDLAAACACEAATNSTINLTNTYIGQVEAYNTQLDVYTRLKQKKAEYDNCVNGICQGTYAEYQAQYDAYEKEVRGTYKCYDSNVNKAALTSDETCILDGPGEGWIVDYDQWAGVSEPPCSSYQGARNDRVCGDCDGPTIKVQHRLYCKRSPSTLSNDWNRYFNSQVIVPIVPPPPQVPQFDAQIAITCCSQNFDNISAGNTVKIYDITQQCSAEVNRYIQQVAAGELPPGTLPPNYDAPPQGTPPDDTAPAGLQTFAIVLIIVAVLVFIAMMIWVGVRLRKRSQKKTPAPTPTPTPAPPS